MNHVRAAEEILDYYVKTKEKVTLRDVGVNHSAFISQILFTSDLLVLPPLAENVSLYSLGCM